MPRVLSACTASRTPSRERCCTTGCLSRPGTQLHRLVGEAIEREYGSESEAHAAELARHFAEVAAGGGEAGKALGMPAVPPT